MPMRRLLRAKDSATPMPARCRGDTRSWSIVVGLLLPVAAFAGPAPARQPADATFQCADSLPRADGQPRRQRRCRKDTQYCYEASGGPAVSHGAQCRPLPKANPSCAGITLAAGGSCTGDRRTGIHVRFAFP